GIGRVGGGGSDRRGVLDSLAANRGPPDRRAPAESRRRDGFSAGDGATPAPARCQARRRPPFPPLWMQKLSLRARHSATAKTTSVRSRRLRTGVSIFLAIKP